MTNRFVDSIHLEIAEEKAGSLGRTGQRLQDALEVFLRHERSLQRGGSAADRQRDALLWDLAERVEAFVVQREACGLRDSRQALKFYGVPRDALMRVGARRPRAGESAAVALHPLGAKSLT